MSPLPTPRACLQIRFQTWIWATSGTDLCSVWMSLLPETKGGASAQPVLRRDFWVRELEAHTYSYQLGMGVKR